MSRLATPAVVPKLEWKLQTQFRGPEKDSQLAIRLGEKNGRFTFFIPSKASNIKRRSQIGFRKSAHEGLSRAFGEFLRDLMQMAIKKWKSVDQMRVWMDDKEGWRETVRQKWRVKFDRTARLRKRSRPEMELISPSVAPTLSHLTYTPRGDQMGTTSVPVLLPEFDGVMTPSISVRTKAKRGRYKPFVSVWIPAAIIPGHRQKGVEMHMGVARGISLGWQQYVVEYLRYVVSKWSSLKHAYSWYNDKKFFVRQVNALYVMDGHHVTDRHWRLKKSTIEPDLAYIRQGYFPQSALINTGYGLFCTKDGAKIIFKFSTTNKSLSVLVDKRRKKLTKMQKHYQAKGCPDDPNCNIVWVPPPRALRCGVVMPGCIMQHRRKNPTHEYVVHSREHAELVPCRGPQRDEEFCYHYNLENDNTTAMSNDVADGIAVHADECYVDPTNNNRYIPVEIEKGGKR